MMIPAMHSTGTPSMYQERQAVCAMAAVVDNLRRQIVCQIQASRTVPQHGDMYYRANLPGFCA